jgi:hypothetical protein
LYLDIVFNKWGCSVTYKQWCNLRELLTTLSDEVDSKICDVKVSEAFDDVWDMVDEIDTTQEIT